MPDNEKTILFWFITKNASKQAHFKKGEQKGTTGPLYLILTNPFI
jgi:hypothetical protein